MNQGGIYIDISNKVATIEFSHPASNSFSSNLLARLATAFNDLNSNEDVNAVLLKSEGDKTFCAGASFDELVSIENLSDGKSFFMGFANVINAMRTCSKPIIGAVQGKAVGGGVGLIAACDYVYATDNASIKLSELSIGIGPFVIAPVVERKIGISGLSELSLNPTKWKNAYWAKEKGLFSDVYESKDIMSKRALEVTEKLASYHPLAVQEMKKVLWKNTDHWETLLEERAEVSGKLVLSNFAKRALQKFKK